MVVQLAVREVPVQEVQEAVVHTQLLLLQEVPPDQAGHIIAVAVPGLQAVVVHILPLLLQEVLPDQAGRIVAAVAVHRAAVPVAVVAVVHPPVVAAVEDNY
jgi:hypothetical protein